MYRPRYRFDHALDPRLGWPRELADSIAPSCKELELNAVTCVVARDIADYLGHIFHRLILSTAADVLELRAPPLPGSPLLEGRRITNLFRVTDLRSFCRTKLEQGGDRITELPAPPDQGAFALMEDVGSDDCWITWEAPAGWFSWYSHSEITLLSLPPATPPSRDILETSLRDAVRWFLKLGHDDRVGPDSPEPGSSEEEEARKLLGPGPLWEAARIRVEFLPDARAPADRFFSYLLEQSTEETNLRRWRPEWNDVRL